MSTVRELRVLQGWSQTELAERAGVALPTIGRLETGKPVSKATLKHVARAFGVSPEKITGVTISQHVIKRN